MAKSFIQNENNLVDVISLCGADEEKWVEALTGEPSSFNLQFTLDKKDYEVIAKYTITSVILREITNKSLEGDK